MTPKNLAGPGFAALTGTPAPVRIIDVGANPIDGTPPYAPLLDSGAETVLGFEPNPAALARLQAKKGTGRSSLTRTILLRDSNWLEPFSDRQLPAASAILRDHDGFPDLVLHLRAGHDRRTGGSRAGAYPGPLRGLAAEAMAG